MRPEYILAAVRTESGNVDVCAPVTEVVKVSHTHTHTHTHIRTCLYMYVYMKCMHGDRLTKAPAELRRIPQVVSGLWRADLAAERSRRAPVSTKIGQRRL